MKTVDRDVRAKITSAFQVVLDRNFNLGESEYAHATSIVLLAVVLKRHPHGTQLVRRRVASREKTTELGALDHHVGGRKIDHGSTQLRKRKQNSAKCCDLCQPNANVFVQRRRDLQNGNMILHDHSRFVTQHRVVAQTHLSLVLLCKYAYRNHELRRFT